MSLLVVGSVAFDAIQTPFHEAERVLGGAAMYFAVAASFFTRVNVVGVVGDDFTAKDEDIFRRRRIDTQGLERAPGKTFFWAGKYSADFTDRTTLATDLNVFAAFNPKLPEAYRTTAYIFLANIDPTLQRSVLKQVSRRPKLVALDTMNYWIERTPAELRETLKHVDVLLINDTETRQLSGEHNLLRAA
ncbi:MAG: sugar kinase, partial [Acidobacteria bacterium]|nr:sugar kinase [Acidobacteriota bacterium]